MQPEQALSLAQYLLAGAEQESATTRKVLEAVPADKADYKPAPLNMTALELAWHIASSEVWFLESIAAGAFAMGESGMPPEIKTAADIPGWYAAKFPAALEKVKALSGDQFAQIVDFFGMKFPNVVSVDFMVKHSVHHRGQLSTYLRPMGSKVPSIYGGSADDPGQPPA